MAQLFAFLLVPSDCSAQELSFPGQVIGFKGWTNNQIAWSVQSTTFKSAGTTNIFSYINFCVLSTVRKARGSCLNATLSTSANHPCPQHYSSAGKPY